jgi:thiol-disulfide isomerase/thioredoxin
MRLRQYNRTSTGPALLFVSATWCPHCKHARPEVRKAAVVLGTVVPVYVVDSEKHKDVVESLKVQGFPTILFRTESGRMKEYRGERVGQKIADWACSQSGGLCNM